MPQSSPDPGISHDLARARARRISGVAYHLAFDVVPGASRVTGSAAVEFQLADRDTPVVLDFAGELEDLRCNGRSVPPDRARRSADHLVLAPELLVAGGNRLEARFASAVAPAGTPLSVYQDAAEHTEYWYTLLVPADAHRLFPCFDQPDLKARYDLQLTLPATWQAVSNAARESTEAVDGARRRDTFGTTAPLPTYLFAFACGPFAVVEDAAPEGGVLQRLFLRSSQRQEETERELFRWHRAVLAWLEQYFGVPYAFGKLDLVLIPGFPYGGMEHAGAVFYRENALVFDHAPTVVESYRRSTLIAHELSHQWWGNLVTMEWFDDLWLKEGFATFMGTTACAALEPGANAWLRFHQTVKPAALRVDVTQGTTPVYQPLDNLDDAKSTYGAIVYNKAPAVLRELEGNLGSEAFRTAVHALLERRAFGSARWPDVLACFEEASGRDLSRWSERWILTAGLPVVRVEWQPESGPLTRFRVTQEGAPEGPGSWPLRLELLLRYPSLEERRSVVRLDRESLVLEQLADTPAPWWVLPNSDDAAYGLFLLDPGTAAALLRNLPQELLLQNRVFGFSALYETLRAGEIHPLGFAQTALALLEQERDPFTFLQVLDALQVTLQRYLPRAAGVELRGRTGTLLRRLLQEDAVPGVGLELLRALLRLTADDETLTLCRGMLDGAVVLPGVSPGLEDRFRLVAALLAAGSEDADRQLQEAVESSRGQDCARARYVAEAARPDPATKERYFQSYLDAAQPPEQWAQESLATFHWPGQEELTLPYLSRALQQLEWVKEHRKIFYLPAWVEAFVQAHSTPQALAVVEDYLDSRPDLAPDVRRKVLQSVDGLRRAVALRQRYFETP